VRLVVALLAGIALASSTSAWWLEDYGFDAISEDGKGVVIAVIDTGIDTSHPDLAGKVIDGVDFSGVGNPSGTAPVGESYFHGTMVASLIVGQGLITGGVQGVSPGAQLLSISIGLGVSGADTDAQIAKGVRWAVDHGADIINLSLSRNSRTWPKSWDDAFVYAFENDVVVVAASGNRSDGSNRPSAPATMPGVISVGGVDSSGVASESASSEGLGIVLTAPAEALLGSFPGGEVRSWSGSSAAAPIVSGLVALMMEKDPEATASDIALRLTSTTTDLGEPGFDGLYGYGLVNPVAAMASTGTTNLNPLGSLSEWVRLYRPSQAESLDGQNSLILPEEPAPLDAENPSPRPTSFLNTSTGLSQVQQLASNPLLYWLLSPLAPLLWIALRRRRKRASRANDQTKVSRQNDSRDH
jgi:subtilisin family serine protease